MVNYLRLSGIIGGVILFLSVISFVWHYFRAKRKEKDDIEIKSKYPQYQQYPMQQQPMREQYWSPEQPKPVGQYPMQQQYQYPQPAKPNGTNGNGTIKKLTEFEEKFNKLYEML